MCNRHHSCDVAGTGEFQNHVTLRIGKAHKHKQYCSVTARVGGGSPDRLARGQTFMCCVRNPRNIEISVRGTRPGGSVTGGDREILYVPEIYVPFLAPELSGPQKGKSKISTLFDIFRAGQNRQRVSRIFFDTFQHFSRGTNFPAPLRGGSDKLSPCQFLMN